MADESTQHVDLGGYLLGRLEPEERARFEQHLAACRDCQAELAELRPAGELLRRVAPPFEVPPGLEAKTFLVLERAAAGGRGRPARSPLRLRTGWPRRSAIGAAAAAALAVAVFAGTLIGGDGAPGSLELRVALTDPRGGTIEGSAEVKKTGIGRVITFSTDELPILPKGEYYELWFVGSGDTLERPNRISAGTFHPDEQGRSHVRFAAAVDPKQYPELSVTAEPGDGNPQRTGPEVLRSLAR